MRVDFTKFQTGPQNPIVCDDYFGFKGDLVPQKVGGSALARRIKHKDGSQKYYVKKDELGNLFNPKDKNLQDLVKSSVHANGQSEYQFFRVNEKTFNSYLTFVQTLDIKYFESAKASDEPLTQVIEDLK